MDVAGRFAARMTFAIAVQVSRMCSRSNT